MVIESHYKIDFRSGISSELGQHLRNRHSVVLIGMKRVGISNFLRFFLYHDHIAQTYIEDKQKHLFIPMDLNDLVERELFPFWVLTLKRIADSVEKSHLNAEIKEEIESLFLDSIQSKDLFLMIEYVRRSLNKLLEQGILPTIFFLRFDRIKEAATAEFFANLEGLKASTHDRLSYVFTTSRDLNSLSEKTFSHTSLSLASNGMYLKPAEMKDQDIIYEAYQTRYNLNLSPSLKKTLLEIVGGYIQYLQLSLIILHEKNSDVKDKEELFKTLVSDERISLQSEELWESLTEEEKQVLLKVGEGKKLSKQEKETGKYLFQTGFITEEGKIFSPVFEHFLSQIEKKNGQTNIELSKKEHLLFTYLRGNLDQICDREAIIEAVWPEEEALGVSDWAIDRLVARLRKKIKDQNENFEIVTVKTRGFKLIEKS